MLNEYIYMTFSYAKVDVKFYYKIIIIIIIIIIVMYSFKNIIKLIL